MKVAPELNAQGLTPGFEEKIIVLDNGHDIRKHPEAELGRKDLTLYLTESDGVFGVKVDGVSVDVEVRGRKLIIMVFPKEPKPEKGHPVPEITPVELEIDLQTQQVIGYQYANRSDQDLIKVPIPHEWESAARLVEVI